VSPPAEAGQFRFEAATARRVDVVPGTLVIVTLLLATLAARQAIVAATALEWDVEIQLFFLGMAALPGIGVVLYASSIRFRPTLSQLYLTLAVVPLSVATFTSLGHIAHHLGRARPLWDERLAALDEALGFDWVAMLSWADGHPTVSNVALAAYLSIFLQVVAVPTIVAVAGQHARLQEFLIATILGLVITHAVACFTPALGAYAFYGINPSHHPNIALRVADLPVGEILGLRDGTIIDISRPSATGLIAFPSFHTTAALLFAWALWRVPFVWAIGVGLNVAMLAATPLHGSHYVVDLFAGAVVAFVALVLARALRRGAVAAYRLRCSAPGAASTRAPAGAPSAAAMPAAPRAARQPATDWKPHLLHSPARSSA
jgi:PAP2 superfamily protein